MFLEWLAAGFALFGTLGGVYLFLYDPAKTVYANASNPSTVTAHMIDCLRMLVPPYLGLSLLPVFSLASRKDNVRFLSALILCATFAGNVILETQWLLSRRWKSSILFYMAGDITIAVTQLCLCIRYGKRMRQEKRKNE